MDKNNNIEVTLSYKDNEYKKGVVQMTKTEIALDRFENGFNCSQSTFSVFAEELDLDLESALRVAGAFGGGIAGTGSTCGIVTGALMAIGLKYGKDKADDADAKTKTNELSKAFMKDYVAMNKDLTCNGMTGCDMATEKGKETFSEDGLKDKVCVVAMKNAVTLLEKIL